MSVTDFLETEKEQRRKDLQCKLYPLNTLTDYMFVVICSFYKGKWILSKHKKRTTWETQGGHIEAGETPLDAAKRELFEESGVSDADIFPVCDYLGYDSEGSATGVVFLAEVHSLGALPESEMEEIGFFEKIPEKLTYPNVSPVFFREAGKLLRAASAEEIFP